MHIAHENKSETGGMKGNNERGEGDVKVYDIHV